MLAKLDPIKLPQAGVPLSTESGRPINLADLVARYNEMARLTLLFAGGQNAAFDQSGYESKRRFAARVQRQAQEMVARLQLADDVAAKP